MSITDPKAEAQGLKCIGYETSERLARHPSSYYVKVIKRAKYADPEAPLSSVLIPFTLIERASVRKPADW